MSDTVYHPGDNAQVILRKILDVLRASGGGTPPAGGAASEATALASNANLVVLNNAAASGAVTLGAIDASNAAIAASVAAIDFRDSWYYVTQEAYLLAIWSVLTTIDADTGNMEVHLGAIDTNMAAAEVHLGSIDTAAGASEVHLGSIDTAAGASEVHLGAIDTNIGDIETLLGTTGIRVGGFSASVVDSTAVSTAAYSANDIVAGLRTLHLPRTSGYGCVLQSIAVTDNADQKAELIFVFFNADPSASTVADHGAFTLHANDVAKVIGTVKVLAADYYDAGSVSIALKTGIGLVLSSADEHIYCITIATGTPDYVAAGDLSIAFGVLRD